MLSQSVSLNGSRYCTEWKLYIGDQRHNVLDGVPRGGGEWEEISPLWNIGTFLASDATVIKLLWPLINSELVRMRVHSCFYSRRASRRHNTTKPLCQANRSYELWEWQDISSVNASTSGMSTWHTKTCRHWSVYKITVCVLVLISY